jgi:hypothetical protein
MNNKTLIQVFLILLVFVLSFIFYLKYFYKNDLYKSIEQEANIENDRENLSDGNTISDILYENYDKAGNKFIIKSKTGIFNSTDKNQIYMTNVLAQIILKNGTLINLTSKNAKYNSSNSNTNFLDSVRLEYLNHIVNSDNIDVILTESRVEAYNNLIYRNSDINLKADKLELDLLTKNTKIFMFDNSKVKIIKD